MSDAGACLAVDVATRRGEFTLEARFQSEGPITAIFGPSGAGKTTLLDLIAGLSRPQRGRIGFGDEVFVDTAGGLDLPPERRRIGYVFQQPRLFPHLRVRDNLHFGRGGAVASARFDFDQVVELLGIAPLLSRWPATLSGGEAQRVALGRAVLSGPRLLLCDEPLSGVEQPKRRAILDALAQLVDTLGLPTLYVSHALPELLHLTQRFVVLNGGQVAAAGDYLEILQDGGLDALSEPLGLLNVIHARVVVAPDASGEAAIASAAGHELRLPPWPLRKGDAVDVALRPEDVSLSTSPLEGLSVQNQLRGVLVRCRPAAGLVAAHVDLGQGVGLVAKVTRRAARDLALDPGREVYCLFKTSTLRRV